jgi:acetyl esterase
MPLDSHAKRFLDMAGAGGVPDISRLSAGEMREAFRGLALAVGPRHVPIGKIENGELPGPAGPLRIRVYTPVAPAAEPLAGLIYFHGGGWVFGDLDTHDGICRTLANEAACRVVAVDYRLAPAHAFPAAVDDSYAATTWVAENAARLGIDANRLAIGGDSAGGNLAAVVCQRAKLNGPRLALQVLFCPVMDMSIDTPSRRALAAGYFLDEAMIDWSLKLYCPQGLDLSDPRISPLRASDFSRLPPAHIHTAEFDPLRDEGKAYADELVRAGVPVRYTCHAGMIHHFYGMGGIIPYARTALQAASVAIKEAMAQRAAAVSGC